MQPIRYSDIRFMSWRRGAGDQQRNARPALRGRQVRWNHRRRHHQHASPLDGTVIRETYSTERVESPLASAVSGCQRPSFAVQSCLVNRTQRRLSGAIRRLSHRYRGTFALSRSDPLARVREALMPASHVPGTVKGVVPNLPAPGKGTWPRCETGLQFNRHFHERRPGADMGLGKYRRICFRMARFALELLIIFR